MLEDLENIAHKNPMVTSIATQAPIITSFKIKNVSLFKNLISLTCVQSVYVDVDFKKGTPQFKELKFQTVSNITDKTLKLLPQDLEILEFSECALAGKRINLLNRYEKLQKLDIRDNKSDETTENRSLKFPLQLRHLNLSCSDFRNDNVSSLKNNLALTHLYLDNSSWVTKEVLESLPLKLEVVSLSGCHSLKVEDLKLCQTWSNLKQLYLSNAIKISSLLFEYLPPSLRILDCSFSDINDLSKIERLEQMKELRLSGNNISTSCLSALPPLLQKLDLGACQLKDEHIEQLQRLKHLTYLNMSSSASISDCALAYLSNLNTLIHLDVSKNTQLTARALQKLPISLVVLLLEQCDFDDDLMEYVAPCTQITTLNLNQNSRITGSKLHLLSKKMKHLHLAQCDIDDNRARCFAEFTSLITLDLRHNVRLTEATAKIFPKQIEKLYVSYIPKQALRIDQISRQNKDTLELRSILSRIADLWSALAKYWAQLSKKQHLIDIVEFESSKKICDYIRFFIQEKSTEIDGFIFDALVAYDPENGVIQAMAIISEKERELKLELLATNPYNIRSSHTTLNNLTRTSQAASSIVISLKNKVTQSAWLSGITLQPTPTSIGFYKKLGFETVEGALKSMRWKKK